MRLSLGYYVIKFNLGSQELVQNSFERTIFSVEIVAVHILSHRIIINRPHLLFLAINCLPAYELRIISLYVTCRLRPLKVIHMCGTKCSYDVCDCTFVQFCQSFYSQFSSHTSRLRLEPQFEFQNRLFCIIRCLFTACIVTSWEFAVINKPSFCVLRKFRYSV